MRSTRRSPYVRRSGFGRSAAVEVGNRLANLLLAVHNERPIADDRLIDRLAGEHKDLSVAIGVDTDLRPFALEADDFRLLCRLCAVDPHAPRQHDEQALCPSERASVVPAPALRLTSHTLMGVAVRAGPFVPPNSPAITRTLPAPSVNGSVGMSERKIG